MRDVPLRVPSAPGLLSSDTLKRTFCCENRLRSGIINNRVVSIVVNYDYDYDNDRV